MHHNEMENIKWEHIKQDAHDELKKNPNQKAARIETKTNWKCICIRVEYGAGT